MYVTLYILALCVQQFYTAFGNSLFLFLSSVSVFRYRVTFMHSDLESGMAFRLSYIFFNYYVHIMFMSLRSVV